MRTAPRLLFLAYYFPPADAIACVRTWAVAKYLSRAGWQVTVVTPKAEFWRNERAGKDSESNCAREGITVYRTSHHLGFLVGNGQIENSPFRRLTARLLRKMVLMGGWEPMLGWTASVRHEVKVQRADSYDVVLATGWPFLSFGLAHELAGKGGCPYVLDYRDLWTRNPHAPWLNTFRNRRRESKLLREAAGITAVSASMGHSLEKEFALERPVNVVTNGYDPEDVADVVPTQFNGLRLVYAGSLYPPVRTLDPVFAALAACEAKQREVGKVWTLHHFGPNTEMVREGAVRQGVAHRLVAHGKVQRSKALSAVAGADVAVVVTSVRSEVTIEEEGILTGKLFEVMALARQILVIAPPGSDVDKLIAEMPQARRFSGQESEQIAAHLAEVARAHIDPCKVLPDTYAWPKLAARMAETLESTRQKRAT